MTDIGVFISAKPPPVALCLKTAAYTAVAMMKRLQTAGGTMLEERHAQIHTDTPSASDSTLKRLLERAWSADVAAPVRNDRLYRLGIDPHTGQQAVITSVPTMPPVPCQRLAMLELSTPKMEVGDSLIDTYPRAVEKIRLEPAGAATVASATAQADLARSLHDKMMAELSASIAHEICQPLMGIVANAAASLRWLQRDTPNVEEAVAGLKDIRAGCERVASIVKSLGALARQAPLHQQLFKVDDAIGEATAIATPALARHQVRLELSLAATRFVFADPVQLQQLLLNLITNALEAMAESRVDGRLLRISSCDVADGIEVCVDDNGPGIPGDQHERIFTAFHTTKPGGLGIGLAVCRSVIDAHRGSLFVETSEMAGARLRFRLPACCDGRPQPAL